jgi:caa(3)-type oxidase subunit IV
MKRRFLHHLPPFFALLILLAMTTASSYVRMGAGNLVATMAISVAKMFVIAYFFMEWKKSGSVLKVTAFVGLMWLLIFLILILSDYATRFPGKLLG